MTSLVRAAISAGCNAQNLCATRGSYGILFLSGASRLPRGHVTKRCTGDASARVRPEAATSLAVHFWRCICALLITWKHPLLVEGLFGRSSRPRQGCFPQGLSQPVTLRRLVVCTLNGLVLFTLSRSVLCTLSIFVLCTLSRSILFTPSRPVLLMLSLSVLLGLSRSIPFTLGRPSFGTRQLVHGGIDAGVNGKRSESARSTTRPSLQKRTHV